MDTLIHADIFFFLASIGFCFIFIFVIIALYYFVSILKSIDHVTKIIEKDVVSVDSNIHDFIYAIKHSFVFKLLFPNKKKK
ncbi:hypothetical protein K8Q94_00420 [Candidatus Nomurabacteria bacterium]|nr:hypothetical protein [Candidatus Nomurabacteria bacterium]